MEIKKLKEEIKNISEPRRTTYGNIHHKLEDIIIIGLCTVICGGVDFADMEEFGKSRKEYLAKFLELPNGIPDSDTFRRVFEKLNPSELSSCLVNWISVERERRSVVAIDGNHAGKRTWADRKEGIPSPFRTFVVGTGRGMAWFKAALEPELFLKILFSAQK